MVSLDSQLCLIKVLHHQTWVIFACIWQIMLLTRSPVHLCRMKIKNVTMLAANGPTNSYSKKSSSTTVFYLCNAYRAKSMTLLWRQCVWLSPTCTIFSVRANQTTWKTACVSKSWASTSWSITSSSHPSLRSIRCRHSRLTVLLTTRSSMESSMIASPYST